MKKRLFYYIILFIFALFTIQFINNIFQRQIEFPNQSNAKLWKNIDEDLFQKNLDNNLNSTLHLYQGSGTNLCGFAAVTYHLIKYNPTEYHRMLMELYNKGETTTRGGTILKPSTEILNYAGTIKNKGRLDINHADQLWFLTLADHYKGYVNTFNWTYEYGDESTTWASTNLNKFNNMWSDLIGKKVLSKGSDLVRPPISQYYQYIHQLKDEYTIMLYLNNTVLNKRNFSSITFPIPTHFVELYDLYPSGDYYILEYWDYGLKTKEIIDQEKFNTIIYGISYIKKDTL